MSNEKKTMTLAEIIASIAEELGIEAPQALANHKIESVLNYIGKDEDTDEVMYEFHRVVPSNFTVVKLHEKITDSKYARGPLVVVSYAVWSGPDIANAFSVLRAGIMRREKLAGFTFAFLVFSHQELASKFFAGKHELRSTPITFYVYNGEIKQMRFSVQRSEQIDDDLNMLLALHKSEQIHSKD